MKPTTKNRWLKLLAWLLVITIIVMLLIPVNLTDKQLEQIKPGMTLEQVHTLLGSSFKGRWMHSNSIDSKDPDGLVLRSYHYGKWWKPDYHLKCSWDGMSWQHLCWIGQTQLLCVEHDNGIITKTWLFPVTRHGGGLQGCIDTLKDYWNQWRK